MTVRWFFNACRRFIQAIVLCALLPMGTAVAQQDTAAVSAEVDVAIAAQDAGDALREFALLSDIEILFPAELVSGISTNAVDGRFPPEAALHRMLRGTGLTYRAVGPDTYVVEEGELPPDPIANNAVAGQNTVGQRQPGIEEIIVTGQKREERIQDVPIAISAFSAEDLEAQKLEGGFDLLKAIPNVSFSKTNFTSYNFQIRGVGTQATSATTDPGVAVAFNNTAIIQNRLFEQEYLDVERVEVLRGPQGTLYGRNATAGVINVISNKPELGVWDGMLDVEVGNYNTRRLRGHFNMPLGDTFALRGAYASTDREGYTYNSATDNQIDGRDLWTGRLSLAWQPTDRLRADLIWERFEEDDDRLRTGKQLCHRDDGREMLGDTPVVDPGMDEDDALLRQAFFAQGCKAGSLYADDAFGTPNGLSLNFVLGMLSLRNLFNIGTDGEGNTQVPIRFQDPYDGQTQSRDLREIASFRDPRYRAKADLFELNVDFDVTDTLQLSSQTAYVEDETYSFQDYNRFNTVPIITDTSTLVPGFSDYSELAPNGVFCDPQLGCSNTVAGFDIAQAAAEQFSQELRLQSSFAGPVNFSVGANYTSFETTVDYYLMYNLLTMYALMAPFNQAISGIPWNDCFASGFDFSGPPVPSDDPTSSCPYIDPNPVGSIDGKGHNYFRSKNPYELESAAVFGELYWRLSDAVKLTAGLRYTDDEKTFTPAPSQVLMAPSVFAGGYVPSGHPADEDIVQKWGEWTGRFGIDWQPVLSFTDESLIYAFYSRGYKGGGANPPKPGFADGDDLVEHGVITPAERELYESFGALPILELTADEYEDTFDAEFVNAYEIGTKNTLFGGALMLNATAFYYDYSDYQVSQIRDRTAINENFDAEMWGLELETIFSPSPNWQFLANVGYLDTKIDEGETSIDIMNRTQSNPDYTLVKPWVQLPSNCVIPTDVAAHRIETEGSSNYFQMCGGWNAISALPLIDPNTGEEYDLADYPELNGGAGLAADLGGNELPQSPNLTVTLGGQYSFDVTPEWRGTVRMDYYWQDESYHRVYNFEPYDRLKSWSNTNLSFWVNNANSGITVEAYVKNLFNETPITGAFLNSDDTGLTTNVFMFDPRLIGVSIRKEW